MNPHATEEKNGSSPAEHGQNRLLDAIRSLNP
jgi:hypothetical protein